MSTKNCILKFFKILKNNIYSFRNMKKTNIGNTNYIIHITIFV